MHRVLLLLIILCGTHLSSWTQETFPVNGVHDHRSGLFAFTNATVFVSADQVIESGMLLIENGKVRDVGSGVSIPEEAVVIDCQGKVIYPSFIDLAPTLRESKKPAPELSSKKEKAKTASNWNPAIHPEYEHEQAFPLPKKVREDWLASGFGVLNLHKADGIMRGSSQLVYTGIETANEAIIIPKAAQHYSFDKGSSKADYPSSFMGAVALLRQTWYDADWYAMGGFKEERNPSLQALNDNWDVPAIFTLNHPLSLRNVLELSNEFSDPFILHGTGSEYRIQTSEPQRFIEPLTFPKHYDVSDPLTSKYITLEELVDWHNAPCNARLLLEVGHQVAFSRDTLKTGKEFIKNLQRALGCGLSHNEALRALTQTPASFIGVDDRLGTLSMGMEASFFISNARIDQQDFQVWQHWNAGKLVYEKWPARTDIVGKYSLVMDSVAHDLVVKEDKGTFKAILSKSGSESEKFKVKLSQERELITLVIRGGDSLNPIVKRLSGKISIRGSVWDGQGQDETGRWFAWSAIKSTEAEPKSKSPKPDSIQPIVGMLPMGAYGLDSISTENTFVLVNVRAWTATDTGILENVDIYVENGIIKNIGTDFLVPSDVHRIDARGRNVTPGIIDEHSHIAIRGGVNEGTQASSAEVRIGDAINPWDINLFRQLAGGVTSVQLLHGSANPIGGQSAIIKLRWGRGAEELKFREAPGFIKFALGENVKRSNTKDNKGRFPLTRMGVEQTYVDAFTRAKEYQVKFSTNDETARWSIRRVEDENEPTKRIDLELDALVEILNGERFITCHSYVQSEVNMLMHVADSMGFKVNTFTHILEGYKLADKLAAHGAYASTFSDWWAYKFEVNDAIPYNAALLTKAGVVTAINSDDAEMGRRLNQEAAKAMKYGGLSEEEAIKLITINPAQMLHIDTWVGSLEVGKQADLVIWSDNPLSVYSEAESTFIDGVLYFDRKWLEGMKERDEALRARLLTEMLLFSQEKGKKPVPDHPGHYHCDTEIEDYIHD